MPIISVVLHNVWKKKARSLGLALAIAFAVMTVVTLSVVGDGLEQSATAILKVGKANFTIVQKGVPDILNSTIDQGTLTRIRETPGVASAVGVLVETEKINAANPVFIEVGISPSDLKPFGVTVVAGHPYSADATNQMMLGWRAAQHFGIHVGDKFKANGTVNTVVGIFSTGNSFGDDASMFPLPALQGYNRVPGIVTMVFVKTVPGVPVSSVTKRISRNLPELSTITTASQFGRADLTLVFVKAAATGSAILAVVIGAIIVGNTMLLSLFERTREFGLLRAIGWTKTQVLSLVMGEGLVLALVGAGVGVGLSFAAAVALEHVPALIGVLHAHFTTSAFWRGLLTALVMTLLGTFYPALRAALRSPLDALGHE
ncbi:MAG: ABC transporter permease [Acidimicrobiales bacterium]